MTTEPIRPAARREPDPTGSDVPTGRGTLVLRAVLGLAGLAVLVRGLVLLVGLGSAQWLPVGEWLVGGVVLHDAVLAPVVVVLGALAAARVPARLRAPLVGLLVVLGPLTLAVIPVLGRFGARPDNPTLLDRPYWTGYLAVAALVVVATAVWTARRGDAPSTEPNQPDEPDEGAVDGR